METLTLGVDGMHCAGCVGKLEKALKAVSGVQSASVSLGARSATVTHDPALVGADSLARAIDGAGYVVRPGTVVSAGAPAAIGTGGASTGKPKGGCGCGCG